MATKTAQGLETRQGILAAAANIASVNGLAGLSLGRLAAELKMSKSGLFAHFGSKEELQLSTIEHARHIYLEQVIIPAWPIRAVWRACTGLATSTSRSWSVASFPAAASSRRQWPSSTPVPGPVRDRVAEAQRQWLDVLERGARDAIASGEVRPSTDPVQLAFELEAAMLSSNRYYHLVNDREFFRRARRAVQASLESKATGKGGGHSPLRWLRR